MVGREKRRNTVERKENGARPVKKRKAEGIAQALEVRPACLAAPSSQPSGPGQLAFVLQLLKRRRVNRHPFSFDESLERGALRVLR